MLCVAHRPARGREEREDDRGMVADRLEVIKGMQEGCLRVAVLDVQWM